MRPFVAILLAGCLMLSAGSVRAADETAAEESKTKKGFTSLIGDDLSNWIQRGGEAKYDLKDGMIVGTAVPNTPNSFLCTKKDYCDFILELDFKVDTGLNSGIMIRAQSKAEYRDGRVHGYQVEIDPSDRAWSAGIYDEARRGWLFNLEDKPEARAAFKKDDWNHYKIRAKGDRIRTWINGVPAADLTDDMDACGFIGLQVHGIGDKNPEDPLQVRWKNVQIKELQARK